MASDFFLLALPDVSAKRYGNVNCRSAANIFSTYIRFLWWLIGSAYFLPNRQTQSLVRFIDKNNFFPHDNRKSTGQIHRGFPCKDRSSTIQSDRHELGELGIQQCLFYTSTSASTDVQVPISISITSKITPLGENVLSDYHLFKRYKRLERLEAPLPHAPCAQLTPYPSLCSL